MRDDVEAQSTTISFGSRRSLLVSRFRRYIDVSSEMTVVMFTTLISLLGSSHVNANRIILYRDSHRYCVTPYVLFHMYALYQLRLTGSHPGRASGDGSCIDPRTAIVRKLRI